MNKLKKVLAVSILITALGGMMFFDSSQAWFVVTSSKAVSAKVDTVALKLDYAEEVRGEGGFTLENTGTAGAYVRLWCTFQYADAAGTPLMRDVSGIGFSEFELERGGEAQPFTLATLAHQAGGGVREKEFVIPLNADGGYCLLLPGQVLEGVYRLRGVEDTEVLRVTWVAEAIQDSEEALRDGAAYGWDAAMAAG